MPRSPDHPMACSPLPMSLSQTPTPHRTFVENKHQSAIRPSGRPSGRSPFFTFFRASIAVNFGSVFSFQLSGRQRGMARLLGFPANCQLLFIKELLEGLHTLGRCRSIRLSCARINRELGHVPHKRGQRTSSFSSRQV
jgi:hypothetical protein